MTFLQSLKSLLQFIGNFITGSLIATLYLLKAIVLFFVPKCLRYKDVSQDIVLVTGGASGLGRLLAIKFAKLGSTVVIWDMNLAGLEELRGKDDSVGKCHHYLVDISERHRVYAAADRVRQEVGHVSILINNAGIVTGKRFLECPDERIIKTFEVNALAHFWIIKSFLPNMMERNHGHICSVASIAGLVGAYQLTDYCASKFAAVGLEESLRLELNCDGYDGIHSTVVCPYYINTGMFAGIGRSMIPVLTPEYVVQETVKAILVNQEILCLPDIVYWLYAARSIFPTRSFLWYHRAIGAASTMKTFIGRNQPQQQQQKTPQQQVISNETNNNAKSALAAQDIAIKMKPETIEINMPKQVEVR